MLSPGLLILAILIGVRWNLRVNLNSLVLYPIFLIGLFGFLVVSFLSSLYILDFSSLLDVGLVKIFLSL